MLRMIHTLWANKASWFSCEGIAISSAISGNRLMGNVLAQG